MEFARFMFEQDSRSLQKSHRSKRVQLTAQLICGKRRKEREREVGWGRREGANLGREAGRNEPAYQVHRKKDDSSNEKMPLPH